MASNDNEETAGPRTRLLKGMAQAAAAKGYAGTTIADVVSAAGVSRRTFYEHFATKADCFIALYEAASRNTLSVLRQAIDPAHEWETQLNRALLAYLGSMAQNPPLLRALFIEILSLGPDGIAVRRRMNHEVCSFMLEVVNGGSGGTRRKRPLTLAIAIGVVGGINEMVLLAIEQDRAGELQQLAGPAAELVRAVAGGD